MHLQIHYFPAILQEYAYCHDPWIAITFPAKEIEPISIPTLLIESFQKTPTQVFQYQAERLMILFEDAKIIQELNPNFTLLKNLTHRGLTVTAKGKESDFVSRTFYPHKTQFVEDAVTGVAHTFLAPYWAKQLGKNILLAKQLSKRGGFIACEVLNKQVVLRSQAILYSEGDIFL